MLHTPRLNGQMLSQEKVAQMLPALIADDANRAGLPTAVIGAGELRSGDCDRRSAGLPVCVDDAFADLENDRIAFAAGRVKRAGERVGAATVHGALDLRAVLAVNQTISGRGTARPYGIADDVRLIGHWTEIGVVVLDVQSEVALGSWSGGTRGAGVCSCAAATGH